jgi:Ca-activated chloride channel homolog
MRFKVSIATVLVLYAAPCGISARDQFLSVAQAQDAPAFSARSELVVLDVLVRDRKNAYLTGLTRDAFTVEEDGVRQTIQFFAESDAPATVGLIIDSSGSMTSTAEAVIAAVATFVETSNPEDEIFALTFNDRVRPVLPSVAPFTGNAHTLHKAVTGAFRPYGRTALYDAIAAGLDYLAKGTRQRKALIVVSDGGDNASRATLEQIVGAVEASHAVIHTIALPDPIERSANPKILKHLAETSGGNTFRSGKPRQVTSALRLIAHDIRNSYTIGYVSTNTTLDGRLREVRVAAEVPRQRGIRVRTRSGYVAR